MGKIKCVVEECKYNLQQTCHADGIEIRSSGTMSVMDPDETACETFAPRG